MAPLARFSGKNMYASHFYHARWHYIEPIPSDYLERGSEGIEQFLDLLNVTSVAGFRGDWARYCRSHPERYVQVFEHDATWLFTRRFPEASFVARGSAQVTHTSYNDLRVTAQSDEVVLRFRYRPNLQVTPRGAATIEPEFAFVERVGRSSGAPFEFLKLHVSAAAVNQGTELRISDN